MTDGAESLRRAYLASAAVVASAAGVLVGAAILTPGTPACELNTARSAVLCPWYRTFVGTASLLFGGVVTLAVPVGLAVGFARTLRRESRGD